MARTDYEVARTITDTSHVVVWREGSGDSLAHPQVLVVPDKATADALAAELPTGSQGMVEVVELMDPAKATALITAARRTVDARSSVSRAESELERRETDLERAVQAARARGNAGIPREGLDAL